MDISFAVCHWVQVNRCFYCSQSLQCSTSCVDYVPFCSVKLKKVYCIYTCEFTCITNGGRTSIRHQPSAKDLLYYNALWIGLISRPKCISIPHSHWQHKALEDHKFQFENTQKYSQFMPTVCMNGWCQRSNYTAGVNANLLALDSVEQSSSWASAFQTRPLQTLIDCCC